MNARVNSPYLALLLFWVIVTACNLTKAVHVDDAVYIRVAENIVENPLRPFAGSINWGHSNDGPLHTISNPPLVSYYFAFVMKFFGNSELILHAFFSLFSLAAIFACYELMKSINKQDAVFLSALFCLGPAFVPGQNLMLDIPLVFFFLLFFAGSALLLEQKTLEAKHSKWLTVVGATAGLACLTKYLGFVLLPIFFILLYRLKGKKGVFHFLLPLMILGAWTLLNHFDFGGIHFLRPEVTNAWSQPMRNFIEYLVGIGALTPYSFLFLIVLVRTWLGRLLLLGVLAVAWFWIPIQLLVPEIINSEQLPLSRAFFFNGMLVSVATLYILISEAIEARKVSFISLPSLLVLWCVGVVLFYVLFTRFMAARHILPVTPVFCAALGFSLKRGFGFKGLWSFNLGYPKRALRYSGFLCTALLGVYLALSDFAYANTYRSAAKLIGEGTNPTTTTWSLGHWGWQWYSEKNGLKVYNWSANLAVGDLVIRPSIPSSQELTPTHKAQVQEVARFSFPNNIFTHIRTMEIEPWGGLYSWHGNSTPWRFSRYELETFTVYQVVR